jgi:hypothetical protein
MTMTRAQALDYVNQQNPTLPHAGGRHLTDATADRCFKCPCCGSAMVPARVFRRRRREFAIIPESVRTGHPRWKCFSCGMVEDVAGLSGQRFTRAITTSRSCISISISTSRQVPRAFERSEKRGRLRTRCRGRRSHLAGPAGRSVFAVLAGVPAGARIAG